LYLYFEKQSTFMKHLSVAIFISLRIWVLTAAIFATGFFFIFILKTTNNNDILFAWPLSFVAAMIGSIPVLIFLSIALSLLKAWQAKWQIKLLILIISILIVTSIYGLVPAFADINLLEFEYSYPNIFIVDFLLSTAGLFLCAMIAFSITLKRIVDFISNTHLSNNNNLITQLFTQTKTNTMQEANANSESEFNNAQQITEPLQKTTNVTANSILVKGIITGVLILIMLIPTVFINSLINERKNLQQEVVKEVSSKWANAQTLTAPFLTIPYTEQVLNNEGKVINTKQELIVLAENLNTQATLFPEARKRSIYKVLLYKSAVKFEGNFKPIWPKDIAMANIDFANAKICFGLSDYKGIEEELFINFNNQKVLLSPGLPVNDLGEVGLSAPITLTQASLDAGVNFNLTIKARGSEQLHFLPLAANSKFNVNSTWASPSFDGNSLPAEHKVNTAGFTASWNFNRANLPFGSVQKTGTLKANETAFGVSLVQPADQYSKTERSLKYAILIIGLSFALFFIIELMQKKPLHPVQYVLVGLALVIFYTLLLSIGEYVVFDMAYVIAAAATILLIALYAKSHFNSWKSASIFGLVLGGLYGFVFILIRLEDAALLVGSIGLFIILALVMYGSRKINWYGK
jgi:inner membrane protein